MLREIAQIQKVTHQDSAKRAFSESQSNRNIEQICGWQELGVKTLFAYKWVSEGSYFRVVRTVKMFCSFIMVVVTWLFAFSKLIELYTKKNDFM